MGLRPLAVAVIVAVALAAAACRAPQVPTVLPTAPSSAPATPLPPWPQRDFPDAKVTVDAGGEVGVFNNPGWYLNQADQIDNAATAEVGRVADLRPRVTRVWLKPNRYFDPNAGGYAFDYDWGGAKSFYRYLDQVSAFSDELMVNVDQCAPEQMTVGDPARCREILKTGLLHYKARYPKLRYVEIFNEPDKIWEPQSHERPAIPVDDYFKWYQIGYQVVAEVNAMVRNGPPLEVGGPAAYTFNRDFLTQFLDRYAADPDPAKRLDFISYHQYRARDNPATVGEERARLRQWLAERRLPTDIPVYLTEYGIFPGNNGTEDPRADALTHAAAMATLGMFYVGSGVEMPMHWVVQHATNSRKSMVVPGGGGLVFPYYNVMWLQAKLKKVQVPSVSDRLAASGLGVNAVATRDRSGVAVMLVNYQWTTGRDGYDVVLNVTGLPTELSNVPLKVSTYLVDSQAGNYLGGFGDGVARPYVAVTRAQDGDTVTTKVSMERNAFALVVIEPA